MRVSCSLLIIAAACGGSPAPAPSYPDPAPSAAPAATPATATATAAAAPTAFDMTVGGSITAAATGAATPIVATREIHAKDQMFVTVTTTQRTSLYVAYCDTSQQLTVYPPTGEVVAEANTPTRIPRGDSFIADASTGKEHLYVIASAQPLSQGDPKLWELVHAAQGANVACPPEVSDPPTETATPAPTPAAASAPAPAPASAPKSVPLRGAPMLAMNEHRVPARLIARGFSVGAADAAAPTRTLHSDPAGIAIFPLELSHK